MVRTRAQSLLSGHRRVQGQWAQGRGRSAFEESGSPGMLPAVPNRTLRRPAACLDPRADRAVQLEERDHRGGASPTAWSTPACACAAARVGPPGTGHAVSADPSSCWSTPRSTTRSAPGSATGCARRPRWPTGPADQLPKPSGTPVRASSSQRCSNARQRRSSGASEWLTGKRSTSCGRRGGRRWPGRSAPAPPGRPGQPRSGSGRRPGRRS